eukprot:4578404-Prymnesium_polylepis.4
MSRSGRATHCGTACAAGAHSAGGSNGWSGARWRREAEWRAATAALSVMGAAQHVLVFDRFDARAAPAICPPQEPEHATHPQSGEDIVVIASDWLSRRLAIREVESSCKVPVGDVRIRRCIPPVGYGYTRLLPAPLCATHRALARIIVARADLAVAPRTAPVWRRLRTAQPYGVADALAACRHVGRRHYEELAVQELHVETQALHAGSAHEL